MLMKIERDQRRFRQIVRGRIRQNLRKYVTHGEMIGRKGRDLVSIPVPQLDVPHFRFGDNGSGRRRAGRRRRGPTARQGRRTARTAQGPAGSDPGGGTSARSRCHARRAGRDPGRGAGAAADRAQGQRLDRPGESPSTTAFARPVPSRCGTSSGRTCKALRAADFDRTSTSRTIRASCRSRRTSSIAPGRRSSTRRSMRPSST